MIILGIESTCDETGTAIVKDGRQVLANVVTSSVELHKKYAGVVPEVAAREQIRSIIPVLTEALSKDFEIDAIAVAYGPGLVGSLLIGVETAKTLALVWDKPLIPINHLMGHVYANWLSVDSSQFTENNHQPSTVNREPTFPLIALIVSGGHTDLLLMTNHGKYKWLGGTLDDAAGEAFDKVARVLGLEYPGGPQIERLVRKFKVQSSKLRFPRPMKDSDNFDFSFSGLKTAVVNLVHSSQFTVHSREEIAFEFQKAIVEVLTTKTLRAAKKFDAKSIVVGGGVAANSEFKRQMSDIGKQNKINIFFPPKDLAIDNGAMIAAAAFFIKKTVNPLKLSADPGLYFIS